MIAQKNCNTILNFCRMAMIIVYNTLWFYMQVPQGNTMVLANTQTLKKEAKYSIGIFFLIDWGCGYYIK